MGLLDAFKSYRKDKLIRSCKKQGDILKNIVTTKEQRAEAIEGLASAPAELAIPQLLKRFELVIDHGMLDTKEKERVSELLIANKEEAGPFVREELAQARRISWLIKVSEKIFSKEEYADLLLKNLKDEFVGFDETVQDRNIELLLALRDVRDPRILKRLEVLLNSRDENVRVAAIECLEAQALHSDDARKMFTEILANPTNADNSRFLSLVKTTAEKHGWI